VGPVENRAHDFRQTIDEFYKRNPHLTEKVLFPGAVYDKKELWEWYNRAKVFVHTSQRIFWHCFERGFYFDNYILSTPVGIASYLINFGYGELVNHNDVEGLASKLQEVIDGKTDLEERLSSRTMTNDAFTLKKEIDKLGNLFPKTAK
jgi:glycosyltransferase involved in cell wall biosynthesis